MSRIGLLVTGVGAAGGDRLLQVGFIQRTVSFLFFQSGQQNGVAHDAQLERCIPVVVIQLGDQVANGSRQFATGMHPVQNGPRHGKRLARIRGTGIARGIIRPGTIDIQQIGRRQYHGQVGIFGLGKSVPHSGPPGRRDRCV